MSTDDNNSVNVPEATPAARVKKKKYMQHYTRKWESDKELCGWLQPSPRGSGYAFCTVCDISLMLTGGRNDLRKHARGKKHLRDLNRTTERIYLADTNSPPRKRIKLHESSSSSIVKQVESQLAAFVNEHHVPINIVAHLPNLIQSVCPDSAIAKQIKGELTHEDVTGKVMLSVVSSASLAGSGNEDGVVLVTSSLDLLWPLPECDAVKAAISAQLEIDASAAKSGCVVRVDQVAGGRVIYAPTGPLDRDYDDARRWAEAAEAGIKRCLECGCKQPLLAVAAPPSWPSAPLLSMLGALDACYVPLEIREDVPEKWVKVQQLGVVGVPPAVVERAMQLDMAKSLAKDIGGSDPERMAPPRVEEYVRKEFEGSSCVTVEVVSDENELVQEYPLFAAVNRCAKGVERHRGRIIYLHYSPPTPGETVSPIYLVGKGVTYDTGGADIKAGGVMAGMHRDKCGAAAVAGYFKFLDIAQPDNIRVTGALCMVRNSVGSDCYVADELITSRAGVRIRIGNTDAEGRMAMGDVLTRMKELAEGEIDARLLTVATLTGHCCLAMGEGYTAIMGNGPAQLNGIPEMIRDAGEEVGEPVEISTIRREDYAFHRGKSEYEDVLQSNNLPSSRTPRGHQTPAAFLILASGLDKHGKDSKAPLQYCHVDIAASSGPFPGVPTGAPVLAFARAFSPHLFD